MLIQQKILFTRAHCSGHCQAWSQRRFCWTHVETGGMRSMVVLVEVDQVYSQGVRECQLPQFADPCFLTSPHLTCILPLLSLNCSGNSTTSLFALVKPLLSSGLNHSTCNSLFGFQTLFKLQLPLFLAHCTRPLLSAANFATATPTFPLDRAGYLLWSAICT